MKNLDLSTLPAKKRKQIVSCLRAGIQLLYFLFLPSVFTAAFNGVKYIFTQLGQGEKIEMTAFVSALLLVCAFTIVFGRFFCGFACAFGSLGDAMHAIYGIICKKRKKKPRCIKPELAKKLVLIKYGILLLIALCCFAGVYQKARGTSPWDVFSMLHAGNFRLSSYIPGIVLLVLILVGMFFEERFFLPFPVPNGSCLFSASDPAVLYSAPETRKLHPRLQRLHETVPVSSGTAIRWIRGNLRQLFPVPEMY